jgi:DNA-binding MarR family transcriptional regulator
MRANKELLRDEELVRSIRERMEEDDPCTLLAIENLVHLLRAHKVIYEALAARLVEWELSPAHYNFLVVLYKAPNKQRQMSDIGEQMNVAVSPSNITKLADALERRGLIRRKASAHDRRVVLAELTTEGEALIKTLMPEQYRWIRHLWSELSEEERRMLTHLLLKLRKSVEKTLSETGIETSLPVCEVKTEE